MTLFQKTALATLLATLFLIFVGAVVRVTGSGLGCPDWPKCWGAMWPPSSLEEVDFDKIDMEKFRRKDPDITREKLAEEFNPVHVWIEYLNRLTSLPVGLFTLATFVMSFGFLKRRPGVFLGSLLAVLLVGANAVLGAMVVRSGLKPGIITLHMVLAILLLCVLVWVIHRGGERRPVATMAAGRRTPALWVTVVLFAVVVAEGVMGSQVREVTDTLALEYKETPRAEWHAVLEARPVYLLHRSFSWAVLLAAGAFFYLTRGAAGEGVRASRLVVAAIVAGQMILGLLMSHVSVSPAVQVLHIGLSSILVVALCWLLLCLKQPDATSSPAGSGSRPRA